MITEDKKFKLAVIASHPIEYQAPLFRRLAKNPAVDIFVYFCWDFGVKETYDEGFRQMVKWDIPLLDGYNYRFLKNYSLNPSPSFWGHINPGIITELRRNKYDAVLIHGYGWFSSWLAFLGAWTTGTPIILRGESDLQKKISSVKKNIKRIVLPMLFANINAFLYSYSLNKSYYKFYGVPESKLFFMPAAVDNDFFQKEAKRFQGREEELKNQIGFRHPEWPTALLIAQLIPRKRPMDLLRARAVISPKVNFNLIIVGDGEEAGRMKDFVKEKQLKDVYFAGFKNQSEIPLFYSISDILVLPSEFDPSPKVINEAMNFGLVIIATDKVGTAPDLVMGSESGYTYSVGDVDELAGTLEKVIRDDRLRMKLRDNSRATIDGWSYNEDVQGVIKSLRYILENQGMGSKPPA